MNIVIPMAGLGKRFTDHGYLLPKPLIPIFEKPMYREVVDTLPLELADRLIFIIRKDKFAKTLIEDITTHYPSSKIVILEARTQGQAETVLKGAHWLIKNKPVLVHNCDTAIKKNLSWQNLINRMIEGALITFPSNEARWSYVKLAQDQITVTDIAEKKVISQHASTGTYFFKDAVYLINNIKKIIAQNLRENNEFYLSTVYRLMISENKKVINLPIEQKDMLCFGTPEDLEFSLKILNQAPL